MPKEYLLASQAHVKLKGDDLGPDKVNKITQLEVEQHTHLPAMFTIRLHDTDLNLLDNGPFNLGVEVEILADTADGRQVPLMKGEITALEPEFREGMIADLVVRGYDKSHRLFRETKSAAHLNVKDSDLAERIGRAAGLRVGHVEPTTIVYDHVLQPNQSDLEFLARRAWRIGFECFVDGDDLYFRKPPTQAGPDGPITLTWGGDLISFHPCMNLAEQVGQVVVKGWDASKKQPIVGKAQQGGLYPAVSERKNGADWANTAFQSPGSLSLIDQSAISQAEADILAAARLDEISGAFIEAQGLAFRRPDIKAGRFVRLAALGKRFSGDYLVTSAIHTYSPDGLTTTFTVSGTRTGLLEQQVPRGQPAEQWSGVMPAIVTNTDDPKKWGRVKVKLTWLGQDVESDWARVIGPGAGKEAGLCALPAVGDEVAVALGLNGFEQIFVLGGLWNGQDGLPPATAGAASGEQPNVRSWRSRKGHSLTVYDTSDNKIEIRSNDGRLIVVDDGGQNITLKTQNASVTLKDNDVTVEAQGSVTIKAAAGLKLESQGNLDIQASGNVTVKGATIQLN